MKRKTLIILSSVGATLCLGLCILFYFYTFHPSENDPVVSMESDEESYTDEEVQINEVTDSNEKAAATVPTAVKTVPVAPIPQSEYKPVQAKEVKNLPAPPTIEAPAPDVEVSLNPVPKNLSYSPISPSTYYAYSKLNSTQKAVYDEIWEYVKDMQPGGYINRSCSNDDLILAYKAVLTDCPQFFWLSRSFIYGSDGSSKKLIYFKMHHEGYNVDYIVTREQAYNIASQMRSKTSSIFSKMGSGLSEFEREVYLHDWICDNVEYENKAVSNPNDYMYAFSAYGAFTNGMTVCEGYCRAFQFLLYCAGVQNTLVTGNTLNANGTPNTSSLHMWSIVRINGIWGYTDSTWNDNGIKIGSIRKTAYRWFNIPENELKYDHHIDNPFALPTANSFDITYFAVRGQLYTGGNANEFIQGLVLKAAKEKKSYIEYMCITSDAIDTKSLTINLTEVNAKSGGNTVNSVTIQKGSPRYYLLVLS